MLAMLVTVPVPVAEADVGSEEEGSEEDKKPKCDGDGVTEAEVG